MLSKIYNIATYLFFLALLLLGLLLLGMFLPNKVGYEVRIVQTGSMEPNIPVGSAVIIKPAVHYLVNDVITFQREDKPITHRIVKDEVIAGDISYTVKGDANDVVDSQTVKKNEVIGKVVFSIPLLGYILDFIRQPLGFILIIGIPLLSLFIDEVMKIIRLIKKKENE